MKRRRVVAVISLLIIALSGCSSYSTKTYVLEDVSEDHNDLSLNIDRIYDYCYNTSTYGNEELKTKPSAVWSANETRRITINEYNNTTDTNDVKNIDYEFGFFMQSESVEWNSYDKPLALSPDGHYMFFERSLQRTRYLLLYNYEDKCISIVDKVESADVPPEMFAVECCWSHNGAEIIYGWKYTGDSQHVVALTGDSDYNNWRYGKEFVYCIKKYRVAKQELSTIYELQDWKFHNIVMDYKMQINSSGYVFICAKEDIWLYLINTKKENDHIVFDKASSSGEGSYWLGEQGIYTQDSSYSIQLYKQDTKAWSTVCDSISDEVDHLVTSQDGNTIYFSIRRHSEPHVDALNNNVWDNSVWDIMRYRVGQKGLEYMYRGANDVIGISLSSNEDNLMLEMRDTSYKVNDKDYYLTKIFILRSYTPDAQEQE